MLDSSKLIKKSQPILTHNARNMNDTNAKFDEFGFMIESRQLEPVNIDHLDRNRDLERIDKLFEFLLVTLANS